MSLSPAGEQAAAKAVEIILAELNSLVLPS